MAQVALRCRESSWREHRVVPLEKRLPLGGGRVQWCPGAETEHLAAAAGPTLVPRWKKSDASAHPPPLRRAPKTAQSAETFSWVSIHSDGQLLGVRWELVTNQVRRAVVVTRLGLAQWQQQSGSSLMTSSAQRSASIRMPSAVPPDIVGIARLKTSSRSPSTDAIGGLWTNLIRINGIISTNNAGTQ